MFDEMPTPSKNNQKNNINKNEIKSLITKKENNENNQLKIQQVEKNLKETLLEKIKKN